MNNYLRSRIAFNFSLEANVTLFEHLLHYGFQRIWSGHDLAESMTKHRTISAEMLTYFSDSLLKTLLVFKN
jgi:hypothetical protein